MSILYQDEDLIAVHKPSGLLSVPGKGPEKQDCVIARLLPEYPTVRCIHRLDRDTSGVLLLALTAEAQRHLGSQFESRQVIKRYEAIVAGRVENDQGEIDLPLAKDFSAPPRHRVDHVYGRAAQTVYEVLERYSAASGIGNSASGEIFSTRLSLTPRTGRSHQLRIHLAALGHPMLGDPLYAPPEVQLLADRLMLHACELTVTHPASGRQVCLSAPCPF